ncbi:hypothetical protein NFI96_033522, partial [Prochilodus magdalenae]
KDSYVVACVWGESVVHRERAKMKLQHVLLCLSVVVSTALSEDNPLLNPRGARPIEHGYKQEKCATEQEWPFCTDDDWGRKCPSGCRIQGLLDSTDHEILKKIEKIRKLLDEGRKMYRSADQVSKDTYTYLRERLLSSSGSDNRYVDLAEQLRQRIVEMKIKIDRQLRVLEALKSQVRNQVIAMQRLEVDIDIKLRSCKGSCASYAEFSVDKESYAALDKQMDRLETMRVQSVETVSSLRVMKSRPMKDVVLPSVYKAGLGGAEQTKPLFSDLGQMKLSLEAEGSTAESAATVSKVPTGTGPVAPSTSHLSCTKTVRKVVTHTKDGLQEKYETVNTGPGCDTLQSLGISSGKDSSGDSFSMKVSGGDSKSITTFSRGDGELGGFGGDFFKDLGTGTGTQDRKFSSSSSSSFSSSSSSSSSSKTILTGGSKSFTSSTKTVTSSPFDFGDDLGAFMRGEVEDDLPDIHARSVKSRDERKAGFVGGDCVDILQNHATGGQSGLFKVKPAGSDEVVEVYCDQVTDLGGWVLVQQREDGSVNFNRTWEEYRVGFGKVDQQGRGEFWIGNRFLHLLTQAEGLLRVELQDWDGKEAYAEYNFKVGPEAEGFQMSVSSYTGTAGDALVKGQANMGSFLSHAGMKFSTFDRDNDKWEENCADMYGGGWWYNNCQSANLNGIYYKGGQYDPAVSLWHPQHFHVLRLQENKCPSGCRLQGLIDKEEEGIYERLSNICDKAERLKGTTSSTMLTSAQFYEAKRKRIVKTYMEELRYAEAAERLHRNLTLLRMKSSQLSSEVHRYHSQILEQITELRRLEVDIDIKLRACKGSCKQTFDHTIDHEAFKAMEDNMGRFGLLPMNQNPLTMDKKVKLQSVVRPPVSLSYRKIPLVQAKLLTKFEDIEQNQVVIEELLQDIWTSDEEAKP